MLRVLKLFYYEILSRFVEEKIKYKRQGACNKCGKCCLYMYSIDTESEKEFKLLTKIFPRYKRFKIIGKDSFGNFIFACTMLDKNNLCSDYKNRLGMCKNYPPVNVKYGAKLHEGCGYNIVSEKAFDEYLN